MVRKCGEQSLICYAFYTFVLSTSHPLVNRCSCYSVVEKAASIRCDISREVKIAQIGLIDYSLCNMTCIMSSQIPQQVLFPQNLSLLPIVLMSSGHYITRSLLILQASTQVRPNDVTLVGKAPSTSSTRISDANRLAIASFSSERWRVSTT